MHILILPSFYPSNENFVRGIFFREQAQALHRNGHQVGVIVPQLRSLKLLFKQATAQQQGIEFENDNGVPTYRWYGWNSLPKIPYGNTKLFIKAGKRLFHQYISEHGMPEIIHAHSALMAGVLGVELKKIYKIPIVITEHSSGFARSMLTSWEKKLAAKAFNDTDKRIVVSPELGKLLQDLYQESFSTWVWVPNIVDKKFFTNLNLLSSKKFDNSFQFLNIALLNENKGHRDLILAFAKSFKGSKNIKLHIGGDGPMRSKLENLASELGIKEQIVFLGMLSRKNVLEEMQKADVFVLSSHYETFGVVLVEALGCGKPVIATACGGPECIVNNKNGLLTPPKNIENLSVAMQKIYKNINLYDPLIISKDCLARFGENAVVQQLTHIYKEVITHKVK